MKKIRIMLEVFTLLAISYSIVAFYNVSGDKLLYLNSQVGHWFAISYKWAIVITVILIFSNALLFIFATSKKKKEKKKTIENQQPKEANNSTVTEVLEENAGQTESMKQFCSKCGSFKKQEDKFCAKCGTKFKN
ncbi:zinc ribbon domain-containing protein [Clostridium sp. E02]|uniref:zinc ribbon domain-containing protein n=1 Tax=Clostridium sp. E02 TaxID=2487134 RepID=UPI000F542146|nr:zinc ribbon domain-containing protein [Clostridium sp. E02]